MIEAILLDLDKTLYPADVGLQEEGDRRITRFIGERLGLADTEADALRLRLWVQHGTTARGLEVEYGVPQIELYAYAIEALEPEAFLQPWAELADCLDSLRAPRCLFTNASPSYARRALRTLGIEREIARIFDIEWLGWVGKPDPAAYHRVVAALGLPPEALLFVDDRPDNTAQARRLGMVTVLVGPKGAAGATDFAIPSILELSRLIAELEACATR